VKKLSALIICLLMVVVGSLTGCATFSINKVKYYNEVLAKVGDANITRFEVLNAYSSYGNSYYVQQMGKTEEEAIESTLDLLIDREVLYQHAKADNKYKPTERQVNEIIEEIFSSLDEQMTSYVESSKSILNIKSTSTEEDEQSEDKVYKYSDYVYKPRAAIKTNTTYYTDANKTTISSTKTDFYDVEYYVDYITPTEDHYTLILGEENKAYLEDFTDEDLIDVIRIEYLKHFKENLAKTEKIENVEAIYNKSIESLTKSLMNYEYYLRDENGKEYSKTEKDLLNRYFERTFTSQIKSQYLENLRIDYLDNETLSVELIMNEFDKKLTSSYTSYVNRPATYKNKMKGIGTDGDTVLYHPAQADGTKFGYFVHTLLSFSDTQKTDIKNLDKEDAYYDTDYASIISSTMVPYRDSNGVEVGEKSFNEVIEEYQNLPQGDLNAFIDFMFTYTGDTATLSSGMPYVVGTNGYSSMVQEFTDESIALMEKGVNSMSEVDIDNINSFCITEYGIHLVYYVNPVDAYDFDYNSKDTVKITDLTKTLNPLTGETYFDMLFDSVYPAGSAEEHYTSNNGYSSFEKRILEDAKDIYKVVKYDTKIKGTKTSF